MSFGSGQSAHDRADRNLQPLGDFTVRTILKVKHQHDDFEFVWQVVDRCLQLLSIDVVICDRGGQMIEMMLLGLVAYRAGKKIAYDGAAGKVTDNPDADALIRRTYRQGWTLNG